MRVWQSDDLVGWSKCAAFYWIKMKFLVLPGAYAAHGSLIGTHFMVIFLSCDLWFVIWSLILNIFAWILQLNKCFCIYTRSIPNSIFFEKFHNSIRSCWKTIRCKLSIAIWTFRIVLKEINIEQIFHGIVIFFVALSFHLR